MEFLPPHFKSQILQIHPPMPSNLCTAHTNTSHAPHPFRPISHILSMLLLPFTTSFIIGMEIALELQVDQLLPAEGQHGENIPPFIAGSWATPFPRTPHTLKRQPLQDITHLFATTANTNTNTFHNGRRRETRVLVESVANIRNKKRKATNPSSDGDTIIFNLKRPLLRRDFR